MAKGSRSSVAFKQIVESWNDRSAIKNWSVHLDKGKHRRIYTTADFYAEIDRDVKHGAYMRRLVCYYKVVEKKKLQIPSHVHKPGWIFNSTPPEYRQ